MGGRVEKVTASAEVMGTRWSKRRVGGRGESGCVHCRDIPAKEAVSADFAGITRQSASPVTHRLLDPRPTFAPGPAANWRCFAHQTRQPTGAASPTKPGSQLALHRPPSPAANWRCFAHQARRPCLRWRQKPSPVPTGAASPDATHRQLASPDPRPTYAACVHCRDISAKEAILADFAGTTRQ